jgi:uncharacterized coiled-coil protein SlyX
MFQRLEDRIKELCVKAAATPQSPELSEVLQQLKAALAEHTQRMRKLVAGFPGTVRSERRSTDTLSATASYVAPPDATEAQSG